VTKTKLGQYETSIGLNIKIMLTSEAAMIIEKTSFMIEMSMVDE